jgi:hypothetical protein
MDVVRPHLPWIGAAAGRTRVFGGRPAHITARGIYLYRSPLLRKICDCVVYFACVAAFLFRTDFVRYP